VRGKRVIDIGCRDGMFSFEAERMGAAEVTGIDNDLSTAAVEFLNLSQNRRFLDENGF
jgi:tRNA (mo5U34)-methyltransferase